MYKGWNQRFQGESLCRLLQRCIPWCALLSAGCLLLGWGWGLGFAPMDYQQKESFRIIYFHVPAASASMLIYLLMALAAVVALIWRNRNAELLLAAMAPVGAVMTFIALTSGSAWGKPMWGTWWEWDARLTSELILLFLYLGAIALYHGFNNPRLAGQAASILVLVGVVNLPIIHFSVEWWNTLHQASTRLQQTIHPSMRTPLRWAMLGYLSFFITLTLMRWRNLLLLEEQSKPWVAALVVGEQRP
ncbi:MAG: heme ABC transporter permease [Enterobacteriaceae bacterium]